jgi:hypothetical protein
MIVKIEIFLALCLQKCRNRMDCVVCAAVDAPQAVLRHVLNGYSVYLPRAWI